MFGAAISRRADGEIRLRLSGREREALRDLPDQLRELLRLAPDDAAVRRLRPPAYTGMPEHEEEYRRFMGDDLQERQLAALAVMEETVDADRLTEEQAQGWLAALNTLRLVLGTQLDVSEDLDMAGVGRDDPRAPGLALYGYLSWLLDQLVDALAAGLPDVGEGPDLPDAGGAGGGDVPGGDLPGG